jgi:hypothetical protein
LGQRSTFLGASLKMQPWGFIHLLAHRHHRGRADFSFQNFNSGPSMP